MKLLWIAFASTYFAGLYAPLPSAFSQPAKPSSFKEWKIPQNALFFKVKASDDWYRRPEEQREWLAPAGLSPEVFKALDIANTGLAMKRGTFESVTSREEENRIRGAAIKNWQQAISSEWLPPLSLIMPGKMNPSPPRPPYEIAYCRFERGGIRGLYLLSLDREFWLYLEQPTCAPKSKQLKPEDIFRPELSSAPLDLRPSIQTREFIRYRAFLPNGLYERVRILLIHCVLPQSLSLANFGYPGQVKP